MLPMTPGTAMIGGRIAKRNWMFSTGESLDTLQLCPAPMTGEWLSTIRIYIFILILFITKREKIIKSTATQSIDKHVNMHTVVYC